MADFDLVLRGGRVVDPAAGRDEITDVAVAGGKIAAVGPDLQAAETWDVSGKIVTPGLIDMHTHVYWGGTSLGVDPDDYMVSSAVTTSVDTGSAGPGNFPGFLKHVIEPAEARILAYLHVSHAGIYGFSNRVMVGESEDIRLMDPITAVEVANAHPGVIVGIKVRLGRHASGIHGMTPLSYAMQVAEETALPLMVHIDEPPPTYVEVVEQLRPGDVLTHCFRPFPNTPLDGDGGVRPEVQAARDRGAFFDIGHGKGSFAFETARKMLAAGFPPDTISSDVHALCAEGPAFDQVTTMSKFLHLGMSMNDVIKGSTETAAKILSRPDLADLSVGSTADISVMSLDDGAFELTDVVGETVTSNQRLTSAGVVRGGKKFSAT